MSGPGPRSKVALVNMPFASARRPSIQLGLLGPCLEREGYEVEHLYLNVTLAKRLGGDIYEYLCSPYGSLLGEWLFAPAAFGENLDQNAQARYLDALPDPPDVVSRPSDWRSFVQELRDTTLPMFIEECFYELDWDQYSLIGFTCTFQQTAASIAMATQIKSRSDVPIVFGGAAVEDEMGRELLRIVSAIDYVVNGEAEEALPRLARLLGEGACDFALPGVTSRYALKDGYEKAALDGDRQVLEDMDSSPIPDYDAYFEAVGDLFGDDKSRWVELPFETARGCWWGERRHCVFCGLNGGGMSFRSKSAGRVKSEITHLARKYASLNLDAVDNILDESLIETVFAGDQFRDLDLSIFYEVKASLRADQLEVLARAGVNRLQPGIESLSSHVLRLIGKGTRAATNVNFLRWARTFEIDVSWNILLGFRGETEQDIEAQTDLIPHLVHLQPPLHVGLARMHRFSPMYREALETGQPFEPMFAYYAIFPPHTNYERVAYFFAHDYGDQLPEVEKYMALHAAAEAWRRSWTGDDRPALSYRWVPGYAEVFDSRDGSPKSVVLEGPTADVLEACSRQPVGHARLDEVVAGGARVAEALEAAGLLMRDEGTLLTLPISTKRTARAAQDSARRRRIPVTAAERQ